MNDRGVEIVLHATVFVRCGERNSGAADAHRVDIEVVSFHEFHGGDAFIGRLRIAILGRAIVDAAQVDQMRAGTDGKGDVLNWPRHPGRLRCRLLRH